MIRATSLVSTKATPRLARVGGGDRPSLTKFTAADDDGVIGMPADSAGKAAVCSDASASRSRWDVSCHEPLGG
jgi:hypothetical protein